MIPEQHLWRLRNEVMIESVIKNLNVLNKQSEGYLRFLCPKCRDFNTSVNPVTNLGRCFGCERNFNTLELVMAEKGVGFLAAVDFVEKLLLREDRGKSR